MLQAAILDTIPPRTGLRGRYLPLHSMHLEPTSENKQKIRQAERFAQLQTLVHFAELYRAQMHCNDSAQMRDFAISAFSRTLEDILEELTALNADGVLTEISEYLTAQTKEQ
ncbi:hypothetical protein COL8621_00591 [Actibacterium lipolyticum]|uniref:Uncharacterized protein n=2 Tax=Actibacterium lipolyticum TaxID=1524263 RepID=A0A238JPF6_9RHOB|nr:hypothetical protein COL8621_00591 [Actibacterium lipolyticum]